MCPAQLLQGKEASVSGFGCSSGRRGPKLLQPPSFSVLRKASPEHRICLVAEVSHQIWVREGSIPPIIRWLAYSEMETGILPLLLGHLPCWERAQTDRGAALALPARLSLYV